MPKATGGSGVVMAGRRSRTPWSVALAAVVVAASVPTLSAVLTAGSSPSCAIAAAGDIAAEGGDQARTADVVASLHPAAVLTLGDDAYENGSDSDFRTYYDPTWGRFKDITRPAPGNHEYLTSGAQGYFHYFGVEPYYTYDLCGWHLYSLNNELSGADREQELSWLRADLTAHRGWPMLAVWHEPRWSSGTRHGSDEGADDLWKAVVDGGVRVVLNGHEHLYERFAELDAQGRPRQGGTREIVVGEGGADLYPFGAALDGSEQRVTGQHGVLSMTLRADGYDWQLHQVDGAVADRGSLQFGSADGATSGSSAGPVPSSTTSTSSTSSTSSNSSGASSVPAAPTASPTPSTTATATSEPGVTYWWLGAGQAAYVKGTEPDTSFATSPDLVVDAPDPARYLTFLGFDLSVVPAGSTVVSGRLYLRATTDVVRPVEVYGAPSSWSQATLTWRSQPVFAPHLIGRIPPARAGEWVSIDVGPLLHTGQQASFVLTGAAPGRSDARFASDDSGTPPALYLGLRAASTP